MSRDVIFCCSSSPSDFLLSTAGSVQNLQWGRIHTQSIGNQGYNGYAPIYVTPHLARETLVGARSYTMKKVFCVYVGS